MTLPTIPVVFVILRNSLTSDTNQTLPLLV